MARNEMKILKSVKNAVSSIGRMMMFDSLINTILAAIFIIGGIIGIIKLIEGITGKKINILPEGFNQTYNKEDKYEDSQPKKLN